MLAYPASSFILPTLPTRFPCSTGQASLRCRQKLGFGSKLLAELIIVNICEAVRGTTLRSSLFSLTSLSFPLSTWRDTFADARSEQHLMNSVMQLTVAIKTRFWGDFIDTEVARRSRVSKVARAQKSPVARASSI
ncbi:hypothetical protein AXF42_Ash008659 [Apostasia shenzhenica]|uniref:Uncharacterized protein n=1 Tax=Apostasia shenzhenica TaxID=1088818 RepID=A0A2I0B201_9ASPA|nr:hypothetical protein AXF42_Ash008659 [Apostasia shenzhenica]